MTLEAKIPENLTQIAQFPKRRGAIFQVEANNKGLALVDAKAGTLKIYVLIDPESEIILDTKFFTYGGPLLTALADIFCESLIGKKMDELQNLSIESLFKENGADTSDEAFEIISKFPAIMAEAYPEKKNVALAAIAAMGSAKLKAHTAEGRASADAEWNALSEEEKLKKIEEALNTHVRAMLAGDGGGLEVVGIKGDAVSIRYQGACAACGAASGGTLYYIEEQLQQHVYYNLRAEPEISNIWAPAPEGEKSEH